MACLGTTLPLISIATKGLSHAKSCFRVNFSIDRCRHTEHQTRLEGSDSRRHCVHTVSGAHRALRPRGSLVVKLKISGAFPPCPSFANTVMHMRRCNVTCSRANWCKMQCFWLVTGRCNCAGLFRSFSPSAHASDAVGCDFRSTCF